MSQRQVNIKMVNPLQDIQANQQRIDRSTSQAMGIIAQKQKEYRSRSEKAMLLGSAKTEELVEKYSAIMNSGNIDTKTALTEYVRNQAVKIGEAKTKAFSPGATTEDKNNYNTILSQSTANINSMATYSKLASDHNKVYRTHLSAVEKNTSRGRLSDDYLNNNDLIEFDAGLGSGEVSEVKINDNDKEHITVSFKDKDGKEHSRDIFASIQAFNQTGSTIQDAVIKENEIITSKDYLGVLKKEAGAFTDLQPTKTIKTKYDRKANTETQVKVSEILDARGALMSNHKDFLLGKTTAPGFDKKWDQLGRLKLLDPNSKFNGISWNTFNSQDSRAAVYKLNEQTWGDNINDKGVRNLDPTPKTPFTVDDYEKLQKEMREDAARGLSNLLGNELDEPVETIVQQSEKINKYKETNNKGGLSDAAIRRIRRDTKNIYDPVSAVLGYNKDAYSSYEGIKKTLKTPKVKKLLAKSEGIDFTKKDILTGSEIVEKYKKAELDIPQELIDGLENMYIVNTDVFTKDFSGGFEYLTGPDNYGFVGNEISNDGRRNLFRLLGVEYNLYDQVNSGKF
jgi:hypothetical protein